MAEADQGRRSRRARLEAQADAARAAFDAGAVPAAIDLYRRVLNREPDHARALGGLALAHLSRGEGGAALAPLARLTRAQPRAAFVWFALGAAMAQAGRVDDAARAYAVARALDPADGAIANNLGGTLQVLGRIAGAARALAAAARLPVPGGDAARAAILVNLGHVREILSDLEGAAAAMAEALALGPGTQGALFLAGRLALRRDETRVALAWLDRVIAQDPDHAAGILERALAREAQGDHRGAEADLARGKALTARSDAASACRPERLRARIDASARLLAAPADPTVQDGAGGSGPVFLMGFPRSGTTLAETILARHGQVVTTGEWSPIEAVVARLDARGGVEALARGDQGLRDDLRAAHAEAIRVAGHDPAKLVIDKAPLNLVHLGLIAAVFPDARILMALRDPRDVVWSCYERDFALNDATVQFLSLDGATALYGAVMDLWRCFAARPGPARLVHRYEDLVAAPEAWVARVCAFLGLTPDPAMLGPGAPRAVATPSRDAVWRPVTGRAVGRWRHHLAALAPHLAALAPYVDAFGYDPA